MDSPSIGDPVALSPVFSVSGRIQNKSKMARVEQQQCAPEGSTESPYYLDQLSYFTIYLTKGIEILEYYTKVSC